MAALDRHTVGWFIFLSAIVGLLIPVRRGPKGPAPLRTECRFDRAAGRVYFVYSPLLRTPYTEEAPLSQFIGTELVAITKKNEIMGIVDGDSILGCLLSVIAGIIVQIVLDAISGPDWGIVLLSRDGEDLLLASLHGRDGAVSLTEEIGRFLPSRTRKREARMHYERANASYDEGDLEGAIQDYGRAIEDEPKNGDAYVNRGLTYDEQGFHSSAIRDFDKAIELSPDQADAHLYRALARKAGEDVQGAAADFQKVLDLTDDASMRQEALAELRKLGVPDSGLSGQARRRPKLRHRAVAGLRKLGVPDRGLSGQARGR